MTARAPRRLLLEDWARRVNALARHIDRYASGVHPSALVNDPYYQRMVQRYRALAAAPTRDDDIPQLRSRMITDFPALAIEQPAGRTFVGAIPLRLLAATAELPGGGVFWRGVAEAAGLRARRPSAAERDAQIARWEATVGDNPHPEPLLPPITALMVPIGREDRPVQGNPQPSGQPELEHPDYLFAGSALILNHTCGLLILREMLPFAAALAVLEAGAIRSRLYHVVDKAQVAIQCIPYRDRLQLAELWSARQPVERGGRARR